MEIPSKFMEREYQSSPLNSPNSHGSSSTTTSCSNNNNNMNGNHPQIPITRSDPNSPYPTTFVTADTCSFKQLVQMLTGSSETTAAWKDPKQPSLTRSWSLSRNIVIPPIKTAPNKKQQQGFKLYERRNKHKNMISPLTGSYAAHGNASFSPRNMAADEKLSPSILDFPSLTLSPDTPLVEDLFNKSSPTINGGGSGRSSEEDRGIAEKGFYMHPSPSPMSTPAPRDAEPQLLPLFPLSSPRVSDPDIY